LRKKEEGETNECEYTKEEHKLKNEKEKEKRQMKMSLEKKT